MISHEEIKKQCLGWWKEVLISEIEGQVIFPRSINRFGKLRTRDLISNLLTYRTSIDLLRQNAKETNGYGYTIRWEQRTFEKIGKNPVPTEIIIETHEDYLKLTGREKEYKRFRRHFALLLAEIPSLKSWAIANPLKLIEYDEWEGIIKVCRYFLENPRPNLYIRQLPIDVHTKFIQQREALFRSLLDFLLPGYINPNEKDFEKRYHLRYSEPLIRLRYLDPSIAPFLSGSDLSVPLTSFVELSAACERIVVAENIMNFLTLPELPGTIALWSGGGFNVSYLRNIQWLRGKRFYYWGDIDAYGFQILNQFRSYYPNTKALMMNEEALSMFQKSNDKKAPKASKQELKYLTEEELSFYYYLNENQIRLEQEKIQQDYAERKMRGALFE